MRFATIAQKPITFSLLSQISFVDSLNEISDDISLTTGSGSKYEKLAFEMNNLRSSKTDPAQAIRNANIALVTVNREDSLTQLVNAHAIKTKPAVIHSYVKLSKFRSQMTA